MRKRRSTVPRQRHRGWSLDIDSRRRMGDNVISTPSASAKKNGRAGVTAESSTSTTTVKHNAMGVASALLKTLSAAASETYATHNHWASPGIQRLYNIAHYTRLSPTRGAGDLGMDDTSKEALEVMRATTLDYIGHSSDCIDELCAVLTRSYTGAAAGEVVEEDSAAGDEVQARMRRLERDLAKSEAARIRAEAEVARLRRT